MSICYIMLMKPYANIARDRFAALLVGMLKAQLHRHI